MSIPSKEAIAYGRDVLTREVERLKKFEQQARANNKLDQAERWKRIHRWIEWQLLGGEGCVIRGFDDRWLDDDFRSVLGEPVSDKQECRAFRWIGQSMEHCDTCGRDIKLHDGLAWHNTSGGPFALATEITIPFDEARTGIPLFGHYVTPVGRSEGPYRYQANTTPSTEAGGTARDLEQAP